MVVKLQVETLVVTTQVDRLYESLSMVNSQLDAMKKHGQMLIFKKDEEGNLILEDTIKLEQYVNDERELRLSNMEQENILARERAKMSDAELMKEAMLLEEKKAIAEQEKVRMAKAQEAARLMYQDRGLQKFGSKSAETKAMNKYIKQAEKNLALTGSQQELEADIELSLKRKTKLSAEERAILATKIPLVKDEQKQIMYTNQLKEIGGEIQKKNDREWRVDLMQASIGMFVLGITANQTLSTLKEMVGEGTVLGEVFDKLQQGIKFMLGPIQVMTAMMQFASMQAKELQMTLTGLMGTMMGIYLIYAALTTKNKELALIMGILGGVITMLSLRYALLNLQKLNLIRNNILEQVTSSWILSPVALAVIGAAMGAGIILWQKYAKGQTMPNTFRDVRESGPVYLHKGETISRGEIGNMKGMGKGNITVNLNINGNTGDSSILTGIARAVERGVASGMGA